VNLPYILWVAAFNTTFIFGYLFLDLFFFPSSSSSKTVYSTMSKPEVSPDNSSILRDQHLPPLTGNPPALLEAINRNGLVLFILVSHLSSSPSLPGILTTLFLRPISPLG
jgi:phosphatidylinositol glycan class W